MIEGLVYFYILAVSLSFTLLIILLVLNIKNIKGLFPKIKKTTWFLLLGVFVLGFYTISITPSLFFTLHDETSFVRHAQELSEGNFQSTDKSIGYPFLMAILFIFTGANFSIAYLVNLALGSLSIVLIFFVTYLLFGREDAGVYSSVFLSLFIPYLMTVKSLESNVAALFVLLLAMMCFLLYFKIRTFKSQLLAAVSLSFAIHFRLEFILLPFFFALMIMLFDRDLGNNVRNYRWWIPWILLIVFAIPWTANVAQVALLPPERNPYIHTSYMNYKLLSFDALSKHSPYILDLFINADFFPSYMLFFLLLGPVSMILNRRKEVVFLLAMFAVFMMIYLSFDIPQNRYFLVPYLFLILFWSKGISFLSELLQKFMKRVVNIDLSLPALLFISVLIFSVFLPYVFELHRNPSNFGSPTQLFWEQREVYLEREALYYLNMNLGRCNIVTVDDEFFAYANLKPLGIEDLMEKPEILNKTRGCLLFFEDLYCKAPLALQDDIKTAESYKSLCNKMHENFNLTTYINFNVTLPETLDSLAPKIIRDDWGGFTLYNISSK